MTNYIFSPTGFTAFIDRILNEERHFWSDETNQFLNAMLESSKTRIRIVLAGSEYFRARACNTSEKVLPKEEMKPKKNLRSEGRVNPYNINVLYLANRKETAIAETRASNYKNVTVARFITTRDLKLVDLTLDRPNFDSYFFAYSPQTQNEAERYAWVALGGAFSAPAEQSMHRDLYTPTQIIAEFFKHNGFDGIIYQSQFDARQLKSQKHEGISENIALFYLGDADPVDAETWTIQHQIIEVAPKRNTSVTYKNDYSSEIKLNEPPQ